MNHELNLISCHKELKKRQITETATPVMERHWPIMDGCKIRLKGQIGTFEISTTVRISNNCMSLLRRLQKILISEIAKLLIVLHIWKSNVKASNAPCNSFKITQRHGLLETSQTRLYWECIAARSLYFFNKNRISICSSFVQARQQQ